MPDYLTTADLLPFAQRLTQGLTHAEVARAVGVSRPYVTLALQGSPRHEAGLLRIIEHYAPEVEGPLWKVENPAEPVVESRDRVA